MRLVAAPQERSFLRRDCIVIANKQQSLPKVIDVCADDAEILALCVSRFIAAGYMTGDVACWDAAYDGAERKLGPIQGRRFVAIVTGLMRAIRIERQRDWSFMPATCCRVTPHEGELMAAIAVARTGRLEDIREAAAGLVGLPHAPLVEEALREVAGGLDNARTRRVGEAGTHRPMHVAVH